MNPSITLLPILPIPIPILYHNHNMTLAAGYSIISGPVLEIKNL
jgi:hypothetical protein